MDRDRSLDNPARFREEDEFNRWPFSKRLADTIAEFDARDGAPVIGIFGRWGYGKSTVLNFICEELRREHGSRIEIFEFNPWMFKDQESLVRQFIHGLAAALDKSLLSKGQKVGELLEYSSSLLGLIPVAGNAASKIAEKLGGQLARRSLDEELRDIANITRSSDRKVVVLIDDLDRLDRDEILVMLKLVRLAANFPQIVYLLAFDDQMVARVAGERYGGSIDAGRQFLEKIVQYPFSLPAVGHRRLVEFIGHRARDACTKAGVTLAKEDWLRFTHLADTCFIRRLVTPRQAIRYGNALDFALPMLKGEVDPFQQIIVEGLRVLFPELYAFVRDNTTMFAIAEAWNEPEDAASIDKTSKIDPVLIAEIVKNEMDGADEGQREAGAILLSELFVGSRREKSVSIERYFDRYFSYSVAPGDIAEIDLEQVLGLAQRNDEPALATLLARLAHRNAPALIGRLGDPGRKQNRQVADRLVKALAQIGRAFAAQWEVLDDRLSLHFATLMAELVVHWPSNGDKRAELAQEVLEEIEPLPLALLFLDELTRVIEAPADERREEPSYNKGPLLSSLAHSTLCYGLVDRIERSAQISPLYEYLGENDTRRLLAHWYRYNEFEVRKHLSQRLKDHPAESVQIIKSFYPSDIYIDGLVDAEALADALVNHFGETRLKGEEMSDDLRIARKFLEETAPLIQAKSDVRSFLQLSEKNFQAAGERISDNLRIRAENQIRLARKSLTTNNLKLIGENMEFLAEHQITQWDALD